MHKIRTSYEHTINASYIGYITQAIVNNFVPLLFLTFVADYGLTLDKITLITTLNFAVQLVVDLVSTKVIDRIGYRVAVFAAHIFAAGGLIGLAVLPEILGNTYVGILIAVICYAIGGGIIEVLISPIVEACPTQKKEAAMSLLHSFYCWGHVAVVLLSTLFFQCFGIGNWRIMACLWALIPLCNAFYYLLVPIFPITGGHQPMPLRTLLGQKMFWLIVVVMICAGASEQAMSQWASAFAESALRVSKTVGDLAGPCAFAICMGTARAIYGKYSEAIPLKKMMMGSALLCIGCYAVAVFAQSPIFGLVGCAACGFSVGIFWPGTFSIAAINLPGAGTAMYALLALAGDIGCSAGPTVVGMVANRTDGNLKNGLLVAMIFPVLILLGIGRLRDKKKHPAGSPLEEIPDNYRPLFDILAEQTNRGKSLVIGIDGRSGSGKTDLAAFISEIYNCNILHMDDFYLPMEQRPQNWQEIPGGNMDLERFAQEALLPAKRGEKIHYRAYDCQTGRYRETRVLPECMLTLVEGSYCQHPSLREFYDLTVFVTCPGKVQAGRLQEREGAHYKAFEEIWIPMEERYFESFAVEQNSQIVIHNE